MMAIVGGLEASPLRVLPVELLLKITDSLPTPDLGAFRLSCRAIHTFLDTSFIKEFFTQKQFMISVFSLTALVRISESRLAPHLRSLHLGLDRLQVISNYRMNQAGFLPEEQLFYNDLLAGEKYAKATGTHQELLATALKKLPNLESIVIRDHDLKSRIREGRNALWKSYGAETIFQATGLHPSHSYGDGPLGFEASDAFSLVVHACAQSGARPRAIEVITHDMALTGHAFFIPTGIMQQSVISVIEGLEKLHLNLLPEFRDDGGPDLSSLSLEHTPTTPVSSRVVDPNYLLHQFLCKARNLRDLRINQMDTKVARHNNPASYILDWLAIAATSSSLILPKLQHFSSGRFTISARDLTRLIRAFSKRLRSLELRSIVLFQPLPELAEGEYWPMDNMWSAFFQDLRKIPDLDLHHIKFSRMSQKHYCGGGHFGPLCKVGVAEERNIDYTGPDWRKHLEEKETDMEIEWHWEYVGYRHC